MRDTIRNHCSTHKRCGACRHSDSERAPWVRQPLRGRSPSCVLRAHLSVSRWLGHAWRLGSAHHQDPARGVGRQPCVARSGLDGAQRDRARLVLARPFRSRCWFWPLRRSGDEGRARHDWRGANRAVRRRSCRARPLAPSTISNRSRVGSPPTRKPRRSRAVCRARASR